MLFALLLAVVASPVQALTLSETGRSTLAPGVELVTYRTATPTTDTHVLEVDLCEDGIRLDATRTPTSVRTVASWAGDYGPVAAVNGDFFRTGPVRVYGDAVGGAVGDHLLLLEVGVELDLVDGRRDRRDRAQVVQLRLQKPRRGQSCSEW